MGRLWRLKNGASSSLLACVFTVEGLDELGSFWPPRCVSDALEGITFLPLAFWLWFQETKIKQGGV